MKKKLFTLLTIVASLGLLLGACDKGNESSSTTSDTSSTEPTPPEPSTHPDPEDDIGQVKNQDGFLLKLINNDYHVLSYDGKSSAPVIPDTVDGHKVTTIMPYAFSHNDWMNSITIGSNIKAIYDYAFYDCTVLTAITFKGNSLSAIGMGAFSKASFLSSILLPTSVNYIGVGAFSYCYSLKKITIPNAVTEIAPYLFYDCRYLEEVTTGDNVTSYGEYAFYNNYALEEFTFSSKTIDVGDSCFANCRSLSKLVFPSQMKYFGTNVLSGCSNLEELTVPFIGPDPENNQRFPLGYLFGSTSYTDSYKATQQYIAKYIIDAQNNVINEMKEQDYYLPTKLNVVTMNNNNPTLSAFMNCVHLYEINLYASATIIEDYAFQGCDGLIRLFVPNTVVRIEGSPFEGVDPELFVFCYGSRTSFHDHKWEEPLTNIVFDYTGNPITYVFKDGDEVVNSITSTVDIIMPLYEKEGYDFKGWVGQNLEEYSELDRYYHTLFVVFEAKLEAKEYNIVLTEPGGDYHAVFFYENELADEGDYISYQMVSPTTPLEYPEELPTRNDALFLGWYEKGAVSPYNFTQEISDPVVELYARWFTLTDSSITPISFDTTLVTLPDAQESSYEYIDYYFAVAPLKDLTTTLEVVADDNTIAPQFGITTTAADIGSIQVMSEALNIYFHQGLVYYIKVTVHRSATTLGFVYGYNTFPLDGGLGEAGTGLKSITVSYDSNYHIDMPAENGYNFLYWYEFGNESNILTNASGNSLKKYTYTHDIFATVKYELINYKISYHLDGIGEYTVVGNMPMTYTVVTPTFDLPHIKVAGKAFKGWYDNELFTGDPIQSINVGTYHDFDLYPKLVDGITITYNINGKLIFQDYAYGETASQLDTPIVAGRTFLGWYDDAEYTTAHDFTQDVDHDITIYGRTSSLMSVTDFYHASDYQYGSTYYRLITAGDSACFVMDVQQSGTIRLYYRCYYSYSSSFRVSKFNIIDESQHELVENVYNYSSTSYTYMTLNVKPGDVIKLTLVTTYVSGMYFAFSNAPGGFGYSTFNIVAPAP